MNFVATLRLQSHYAYQYFAVSGTMQWSVTGVTTGARRICLTLDARLWSTKCRPHPLTPVNLSPPAFYTHCHYITLHTLRNGNKYFRLFGKIEIVEILSNIFTRSETIFETFTRKFYERIINPKNRMSSKGQMTYKYRDRIDFNKKYIQPKK